MSVSPVMDAGSDDKPVAASDRANIDSVPTFVDLESDIDLSDSPIMDAGSDDASDRANIDAVPTFVDFESDDENLDQPPTIIYLKDSPHAFT